MRMTRQRKVLLEIINQAGTPLSAEEIMFQAHQQDPSLALSTVYRNLEKMLELGLCQQIRFQDGLARFEQAGLVHHHHLVCTACGRREAVPICPLHQIQQQLEASSGYQITYHEINLYGLCPDCQKKQTSGTI
ncbi:MAG: transcriptional repressor [Clostridia bacterium]|nr:transcriptional repressor [Clostridia bacterium]